MRARPAGARGGGPPLGRSPRRRSRRGMGGGFRDGPLARSGPLHGLDAGRGQGIRTDGGVAGQSSGAGCGTPHSDCPVGAPAPGARMSVTGAVKAGARRSPRRLGGPPGRGFVDAGREEAHRATPGRCRADAAVTRPALGSIARSSNSSSSAPSTRSTPSRRLPARGGVVTTADPGAARCKVTILL